MRLADGSYVDDRLYEMIVSEQFEMYQLNPGEVLIQGYQPPLVSPEEVKEKRFHVAATRIDNFLGIVNYRQEGEPLPEVSWRWMLSSSRLKPFGNYGGQFLRRSRK
jgi:hypothetical protein